MDCARHTHTSNMVILPCLLRQSHGEYPKLVPLSRRSAPPYVSGCVISVRSDSQVETCSTFGCIPLIECSLVGRCQVTYLVLKLLCSTARVVAAASAQIWFGALAFWRFSCSPIASQADVNCQETSNTPMTVMIQASVSSFMLSTCELSKMEDGCTCVGLGGRNKGRAGLVLRAGA